MRLRPSPRIKNLVKSYLIASEIKKINRVLSRDLNRLTDEAVKVSAFISFIERMLEIAMKRNERREE